MKRNRIVVIIVGLVLLGSPIKAQDDVKIGKQNIKLNSELMTPEALWAMGRISAAEANADGTQIVYQVGYYSVKANKSQQKIAVINADGTGNTTLTRSHLVQWQDRLPLWRTDLDDECRRL